MASSGPAGQRAEIAYHEEHEGHEGWGARRGSGSGDTRRHEGRGEWDWIPACAGMTERSGGGCILASLAPWRENGLDAEGTPAEVRHGGAGSGTVLGTSAGSVNKMYLSPSCVVMDDLLTEAGSGYHALQRTGGPCPEGIWDIPCQSVALRCTRGPGDQNRRLSGVARR